MGAAAVAVTVHEGVIALEGEVANHSEADVLVRLLGRLDGVVAVEPRLTWRIDDHAAPTRGTRRTADPVAGRAGVRLAPDPSGDPAHGPRRTVHLCVDERPVPP